MINYGKPTPVKTIDLDGYIPDSAHFSTQALYLPYSSTDCNLVTVDTVNYCDGGTYTEGIFTPLNQKNKSQIKATSLVLKISFLTMSGDLSAIPFIRSLEGYFDPGTGSCKPKTCDTITNPPPSSCTTTSPCANGCGGTLVCAQTTPPACQPPNVMCNGQCVTSKKGTSCNDGNQCTTGDVYTDDCGTQCAGAIATGQTCTVSGGGTGQCNAAGQCVTQCTNLCSLLSPCSAPENATCTISSICSSSATANPCNDSSQITDWTCNEHFQKSPDGKSCIAIIVPPPVCTPAGGLSCMVPPVNVTCTVGTGITMHYTTDGNDPTCSSPTWSASPITKTTTLKVIACDASGNKSTVVTNTYTIGTGTPQPGSFKINNGALYTNNSNVTLNITCAQDVCGQSVQVAYDEHNPPTSSPVNCNTPLPYSLSSGDGNKTIYANFQGSNNTNASIKLDTHPPTGGSISYTGGYQKVSTLNVNVNDGTDSLSGIDTLTRQLLRASASMDNNSLTCNTFGNYSSQSYGGTYPTIQDTSLSGSTCYKYKWQVADKAGNVATYSSDIGQGETVVKNVPSDLLFYAGYNGPAGSAIASDYPGVSASVVGTGMGSASIDGNGNLVLNGKGISYPIGSTSPIINAAGGTITVNLKNTDWSGTKVLFKIPGSTNYIKVYKDDLNGYLYITTKPDGAMTPTTIHSAECDWDTSTSHLLTITWGTSGISASWNNCSVSTSAISAMYNQTLWNYQNMYIGSDELGNGALNAIIDYVKIIGGGSS